MKMLVIGAVVVVLATMSPAAQDVGKIRRIYDVRTAEIEATHTNELAGALERYGEVLKVVAQRYQDGGDLDGLLASNKEIERFSRDRTCPETDEAGLPSLIAKVRQDYRDAVAGSTRRCTTGLIELSRAYVSRLRVVQREHVKANELEAAMHARDELKRTEFILAVLETDLEKPRAEPEATAAEPVRVETPPPPAMIRPGLQLHVTWGKIVWFLRLESESGGALYPPGKSEGMPILYKALSEREFAYWFLDQGTDQPALEKCYVIKLAEDGKHFRGKRKSENKFIEGPVSYVQ